MANSYLIKDSCFDLKRNNSDIVTLIVETNELSINYELKDGDYKILVLNNSNDDLVINEKGSIINSHVELMFFDLNNNNLKQNSYFDIFRGSELNILTTYLGINNKLINYEIVNAESESSSLITNNVVCVNDANFTLNVVGTINKGSKAAKCHQKSHCLTIDKPKQAKVLPILKIDENDVEASHSLSSGTIDEEVMFYMNSRGLTKKEALQLMLSSYLLPNKELFSDYIDNEKIFEMCSKKVENVCLK